jgi:hypothetical protein
MRGSFATASENKYRIFSLAFAGKIGESVSRVRKILAR